MGREIYTYVYNLYYTWCRIVPTVDDRYKILRSLFMLLKSVGARAYGWD